MNCIGAKDQAIIYGKVNKNEIWFARLTDYVRVGITSKLHTARE